MANEVALMSLVLGNVVLFDGVYSLCTHSVKFILAHERDSTFRFASLQSQAGARIMRQFGLDPENMKTIVLIANGRAYLRSDAAIGIARHFRGGWRLIGLFKVVPRPLRDWVYDLVARNRYRWFGRLDSCMVPTPDLRMRFIEE
jgi:predicted DCC family thiol-disulfide oxidoreductase YuxK